MIETNSSTKLVLAERHDRLVVLARAIQLTDPIAENALKKDVERQVHLAENCIGGALYRHHSDFQPTSKTLVWSHFELMYFCGFISAASIHQRVFSQQPQGLDLLRAEILACTPSSFILPRGWRGSVDHPERISSLEFLQVKPNCLDEYRKAMQEYCGPAAQKLVKIGKFGTFRAMETAAVLYHNQKLETEWNQIHLCELNPNGFESFGKEFEAVHRQDLPQGNEFSDTFASLGRLRTIARWTFNDPVIEVDAALAQ